ncbi:hypothetical protein glysoja_025559 [Glycine soja]|uniref:Uncharacterized protein n=1 Tax=Glycine soja TaxID=3848 RepID=A0A0B2R6J4_GLYSO|nr:hypothetical protein glysoja_025559 [Glycine soja]
MFICWNDILSMGDAGFMLDFVKFLNAKSFEVREMATEALSDMVIVPRNRKGNKIFLISILMSLTSCTSGRKKIVSSGYAKNIEKLADAEVSFDANRLVKKLSTNRFHNLLTGIWHS